jgi:hypothetical protein
LVESIPYSEPKVYIHWITWCNGSHYSTNLRFIISWENCTLLYPAFKVNPVLIKSDLNERKFR